MQPEKTHELVIHPGFEQDMQRLHAASKGNRRSTEYRLLARTIDIVKTLQTNRPSTHPLIQMKSYPDLSDCETSYVGIDPDEKPSHRLIWHELPPSRPGALPRREVIAFGERNLGAAYYHAGNRLGRPVGISLQELREAPEPIHPDAEPPRSKVEERMRRFPELREHARQNVASLQASPHSPEPDGLG